MISQYSAIGPPDQPGTAPVPTPPPAAPSLFSLADCDLDRLQVAAADNLDRDGLADAIAAQQRLQRVGFLDHLSVQADQDVADQQATLCRGAIRLHPHDQQAG